MMRARLSTLASWSGGELCGDDVWVSGIDIDTRRLKPGQMFAAFKGERLDGHHLLAQAKQAGASAALVERFNPDSSLPQLCVRAVGEALNALARAWLSQLSKLRILALTGSNGKTTVKNLLASILAKKAPTLATEGNRNNEIGVPLTALALSEDDRFAVFEMGAGRPFDIDEYCQVVRPEIALVNNIAPAHLERLGSLAGVAQTKAGVYRALATDGVAVINADDAFQSYFTDQTAARKLYFGAAAPATMLDVQLLPSAPERLHLRTPSGVLELGFALGGQHNQLNAAAACTMAYAAGCTLEHMHDALAAARPISGRFQKQTSAQGFSVIDDSYNANPGSFAAGVRLLAANERQTWIAMGDMAELGPEAARYHAEIGALAKSLKVARLFACGPLSAHAAAAFGSGALHFDSQAQLLEALKQELRAGVTLLVKGSRSSAMDRVVRALLSASEASSC
jgi:UDP-N-acetylmuramoyl-tripeptide--D-alanyl-D-alanine ligase